MAEEIGSLKVSLSIDSADFERSISSIDRNLKAMGQEMASTRAKGNEWGSSITGLTTKKDALNRMLSAQENKVKQLSQAYEKSKAETGENSKATENLAIKLNQATAQYDRTEAELNQVSAALKKQQDELKLSESKWQQLSEKMTAAGEQMKSVGDKMTSVGKNLSMKVTAPIVAVGGAAVKMAADFEAQMDRVGAIAGATGSEMDALKKSALDLGANTSKSASEVAIAMEDMAAMGFTAIEIIGAMPGVISASEASGESLALSAQTVAAALNIWSLEATEAGRVADVLAMAANASAAGIGDMQMAFKYAGAPAAALGIGMEDVAAAIGIMTDAGLDGSNAGTSLRASLLALNNPAKAQQKMMERLGVSMRDGEGNALTLSEMVGNLQEATENMTEADKVATLGKLVGTEAVSGFLSLIKAGPKEIDKMSDALKNSAGESAKTAAIMKDNLKGTFEELGGALETAAITIGNTLIPHVKKVALAVQGLVEKFTDLSPKMQNTILVIAGIAAAIGPVLVILGTLVSSIGSILTMFGTVSAAIAVVTTGVASAVPAVSALAGVFTVLTGPVGLIIAGLAALAVGVIVLVNHLKKDAAPEIDRFGEGVSETTKKALGSFFELSDGASLALMDMSVRNIKITKESAAGIVESFNQMNTQIVDGLNKRHEEQLASTTAFFANSSVLTDTEEAAIVQKQENSHNLQILSLESKNSRIKEIMNLAAAENRALTQSESDEITNIKNSMNENAVIALSASEIEQKVILERMKQTASDLSLQQAREVVTNSAKQRAESVKEAEGQYSDTVAQIIRMRDETGVITAEQATKMIAEAKKTRDGSVKQAESMHNDVVKEAQNQSGDLSKIMDTMTGEQYTKWDAYVAGVKERFNKFNQDAKDTWNSVSSTISDGWNRSNAFTSAALTTMGSVFATRFGGLVVSATVKMKEVGTAISKGLDDSLAWITGMGSKFHDAGANIIGMVADGIRSAIGKVTGAMSDVMSKARDYLPFSPAKVGPLKTLNKLDFGGPISDSIKNAIPSVTRSMNELFVIPELESNRYGTNGTNDNSRSYSGNTTINLYGNNFSPSEIARKQKQAQRQMALEWGY